MTNSYIPSLPTTSISRDGDTPVLAGTKRKRGVLLPASLDGIVSLVITLTPSADTVLTLPLGCSRCVQRGDFTFQTSRSNRSRPATAIIPRAEHHYSS